MKKLRELFNAWRRGEEIEAEVALPVIPLLFLGGAILFFIIKSCL